MLGQIIVVIVDVCKVESITSNKGYIQGVYSLEYLVQSRGRISIYIYNVYYLYTYDIIHFLNIIYK